VSRILVIRGGAIGDFILTLPAIRLLRHSFPEAHVEILGYQHIIALARMSGYADATRSIEYGPLATFFTRDGELDSELAAYFSSFQQILSYLFDPDEIFARNLRRAGVRNLIVGPAKLNDQEHAARQLARPLERLALYLDDPAPVITPNERAVRNAKLWAIHPGSGSETKCWPAERWLALARALLEERIAGELLVVGGEADDQALRQMEQLLPNDRVRFAPHQPLPVLARLLQNCGHFIGHDSGISHLAAAVGTPSLLLFGPTDPAIWAPQNRQVKILRSTDRTMAGIEIAHVLAAIAAK
jgi:heptosyltransferase-2